LSKRSLKDLQYTCSNMWKQLHFTCWQNHCKIVYWWGQ